MRIEGKVVVVTGGASGLGLATARHLVAEKGARVAILDTSVAAGAAAASELGDGRAIFVAADVTSEDSVRSAISTIVAAFGTVHVCINCAGIAAPSRILGKDRTATPLARYAQVVSVNLVGLYNVMSKCAEQMAGNEPERGEERGVVINVSSGAAYEGQIGQCAYASSKSGVIGLNIPAARELGALGIRVNAIAPGLFRTPMLESLDPKVVESLVAATEAPKRLGEMREFAHCCAFIIENAYLNGETIRLDGAARLRAR